MKLGAITNSWREHLQSESIEALVGHDELPALGGGTREEVRVLRLRGLASGKGLKQA